MEDKSLPVRELQEVLQAEDQAGSARRKLIKRVALAGLPVVLATVRGRNAWAAQSTSAGTSANPSATG
jgi:hypothetical protein